MNGRSAVFLDRDGTLIDELGFLLDPDRISLYPEAGPAVGRLNAAGLFVAVVTNQSAVARGLLSEERLGSIHAALQGRLANAGAHLDHIAYCPHHPEQGDVPYRMKCDCRKPAPGMIQSALARFQLDAARSWIIGDSERDMAAGRNAGLSGLILVATGKGRAQWERMRPEQRAGCVLVENLSQATDLILDGHPKACGGGTETGSLLHD